MPGRLLFVVLTRVALGLHERVAIRPSGMHVPSHTVRPSGYVSIQALWTSRPCWLLVELDAVSRTGGYKADADTTFPRRLRMFAPLRDQRLDDIDANFQCRR